MFTVSQWRMNQHCITYITSSHRYFLHSSCFVFFLRFHNFLLHSRQASAALKQYDLCSLLTGVRMCVWSKGVCDCVWILFLLVRILTLIDLEEGLWQFAGEQGFWQVSEVLLQHVGDVIRGLALVVDSSAVRAARLIHLTKSLDTRFNSRFPEETHLEKDRRTKRERVMSCTHAQKPDTPALNCNSLISLTITTSTVFDPVIKAYQKWLMWPKPIRKKLRAVIIQNNILDLSPNPELTVNMVT